jgi:FAD:protein FMN transferase
MMNGVAAGERGHGLVHVERVGAAMGGQIAVHLAVEPGDVERSGIVAAGLVDRVRAWARFLTRFEPDSDLSRLNADARREALVPPTLAGVLEWSAQAGRLTGGVVDVTLLDARLAAEHPEAAALRAGDQAEPPVGHASALVERASEPAWSLVRTRRGATLQRRPGVRFDLDGTAKGWIADRALDLLWDMPGAIVDADGDLAIRVAAGDSWRVGVADPAQPGRNLAVMNLAVPEGEVAERFGLATSGVSVHRWGHGDEAAHHLIDPATRRPAETDVVQATVLATTAREAEAFAKSAVILGSSRAIDLLESVGVRGALLLVRSGEVLALPRTLSYLAADVSAAGGAETRGAVSAGATQLMKGA